MTKIAFTSDLHVDSSRENSALLPHLAEAVEESGAELFVLAGDVGGGAVGLLGALEAFKGLGVPKLFVPGNHDLWVEESGPFARYRLDSATKYRSLLPALCEEAGWHYLPGGPFRTDGLALVGAMGWYDYSLRNRDLDGLIPHEAYRRGRFGRLVWRDSRRVRWARRPGEPGWRSRDACLGDWAILEGQLEDLAAQLDGLEREGASSVVAVTHFLPTAELIDYTGRAEADFVCGFAGSSRLGGLLASRPSVKALICGHTHRPHAESLGGIEVHKSPVGLIGPAASRLPCLKRTPKPPALGELARSRLGLLEA